MGFYTQQTQSWEKTEPNWLKVSLEGQKFMQHFVRGYGHYLHSGRRERPDWSYLNYTTRKPSKHTWQVPSALSRGYSRTYFNGVCKMLQVRWKESDNKVQRLRLIYNTALYTDIFPNLFERIQLPLQNEIKCSGTEMCSRAKIFCICERVQGNKALRWIPQPQHWLHTRQPMQTTAVVQMRNRPGTLPYFYQMQNIETFVMASFFLAINLSKVQSKRTTGHNQGLSMYLDSYLLQKLTDATAKGSHRFQLHMAFVKPATHWARVNELKQTLTVLLML